MRDAAARNWTPEGLTIDVEPLVDTFVTSPPPGDGAFAIGTVAIDPPVVVYEPGPLWIGVDAEGDPGEGPRACLGGCSSAESAAWQAYEPDYEWSEATGFLPLFQITVEHD